ncbi:gamma-secretase subunit pen-2 [Dendroctonus ponderosae]
MDLSKVPNEKKLALCRQYFKVGFALLPLVWAVNALWFFGEAFRKPPFSEQRQIRKYVVCSGLGALLWLLGVGAWVVVFQVNRARWGAMADQLSFIIPLGMP